MKNGRSPHGQCFQGLRSCLLARLDDDVDFVLGDPAHLLKMLDGLGDAGDTRWLCRAGCQLLRGSEKRAYLTENADRLVRTLRNRPIGTALRAVTECRLC